MRSFTTTPCVSACASRVLASVAALATSRARASVRDRAADLEGVEAVTARTSCSVFFASVVVDAVVVVAVGVDVLVAVVATLVVPAVGAVITDTGDVTEVGLVVEVVVDVVAMVTGLVDTVVVAVVVTGSCVVVCVNSCFLA